MWVFYHPKMAISLRVNKAHTHSVSHDDDPSYFDEYDSSPSASYWLVPGTFEEY